jgi:hypothetical protein
VARRPLEREGLYLDGGRRTTQLMRDSLGGDYQPRAAAHVHKQRLLWVPPLENDSLLLEANIGSPAVQSDHRAPGTDAPPPNMRVKLAWPVE